MVKKISCIIMGVVIGVAFAGCSTTNTSTISSVVAYDNSDVNVEYDKEKATKIGFFGNKINIDGSGIKKDENVLTIKKAGTYIFSGNFENNEIVCDASEKEIKIVLDNAVFEKSGGVPLKIENAEKVYIISSDGSYNKVIAENSEYCVETSVPVTFAGKGKTEYKGGIESDKNIVFSSGITDIASANDGVNCEQSVTFLDGETTIKCGKTGVYSDKIINIKNGTINIDCSEKDEESIAIRANKTVSINNGVLNLNSYSNAVQCDGDINISNGKFDIKTAKNGLSSLDLLNLSGGIFKIESTHASLDAKRVSVSGGYYDFLSDAEGIYATAQNDAQINIDGGTINVKSQKSSVSTTGSFNMSGGTLVLSTEKSNSPLTANEYSLNGGICFAVGSNLDVFKNAEQTSVLYDLKKTQKKNTRFSIVDGSENIVVSFVPRYDYDSVAIVSAAISKNKEYSVFLDGDAKEKFQSEIAVNGRLENAKKYGTIKV